MPEERDLILRLKEGNKEAFTLLFRTYYKDLVLFGGYFLPEDKPVCEDIAQSVFLKLWKERKEITIENSLKSYLLRAVRNGCLDEIRHRDIVREHESHSRLNQSVNDVDTEDYILYSDLQKHLQLALEKIPAPFRQAFEMNRFEGLKYHEIAQRLQISNRTVEVRIAKAIELLKKYMKEYL